MRAFAVLAVLALVSASSCSGESLYDECPAAPAVPGDRRKGDAHTFVLAVQHVPMLWHTKAKAHGEETSEPASTRLERIAAEITALDADFVHLVGVEGCSMLDGLVAASTTIDARVAGEYRPYLVSPKIQEDGVSQSVSSPATLTRVDPSTDVYLAPGAEEESGGPRHYFARIKIGRIDVVVTGVDASAAGTSRDADTTDGDENEKRSLDKTNPWSLEIGRLLASGTEVVVVGNTGPYTSSMPGVLEKQTGDGNGEIWVSPGIKNALSSAFWKETSNGKTSSFSLVTLQFKPGAFTNETDGVRGYFTAHRVGLIATELLFAVVFFPGVRRVAFPKGEAKQKKEKQRRNKKE